MSSFKQGDRVMFKTLGSNHYLHGEVMEGIAETNPVIVPIQDEHEHVYYARLEDVELNPLPSWADPRPSRTPRHIDPCEELTDVMREVQQVMQGEARGRRAGWTLRDLAAYCKKVRAAAIEQQLGKIPNAILLLRSEES